VTSALDLLLWAALIVGAAVIAVFLVSRR